MRLLLLLLTIAYANCLHLRIIGGVGTTIEKYPYQVSIHYKQKLQCGGSIISQKWVLTAAHCVYGLKPADIYIRIESSYNDKGGKKIDGIKNIFCHELYDQLTITYDVALIELPTAIAISASAKPISLAEPTMVLKPGSNAVVTGWGLTSVNGATSSTLRALTVPIVDQGQCQKIYEDNRKNEVTDEMLCAGVLTGGKDTCEGDSGGPLVLNGVQVGIVSWGVGCAKPQFPGVYTRVSKMRSWIKRRANV